MHTKSEGIGATIYSGFELLISLLQSSYSNYVLRIHSFYDQFQPKLLENVVSWYGMWPVSPNILTVT